MTIEQMIENGEFKQHPYRSWCTAKLITVWGKTYYLLDDITVTSGKLKPVAYFDRDCGYAKEDFDYSPEFTTELQAINHVKKELKRIIKKRQKEIDDILKHIKEDI